MGGSIVGWLLFISVLLAQTSGVFATVLHPLGWQPGEGQAYFLKIASDDEETSDPAILYLYQFRSSVLVSMPLVDLASPFCREIGGEMPDPQRPTPFWMESARKRLKPFVNIGGGHRIPGVNRTLFSDADGRLNIKPPPQASALAMEGQVYTVEVTRADRPGFLSKFAEWIEKAGYLSYIIQVGPEVYSLRTGCFIGEAEASSHAKRLAKTLGLSGFKPTNDHRAYRQDAPSEATLPSTESRGESMTTKWWFWAGLALMILMAVLSAMAFLRVGGDRNEATNATDAKKAKDI